jgi:hypothetical protein
MQETIMKEDKETVETEESPIKGKDKGPMNFPKERARVARKITNQQMFKGLPKQWKGRGDYFFETQEDGNLKITGGDSAKSLTGGKSTIISDPTKIKEILEKARGGDVIEENVSYVSKEDEDFKSLYNKEELGEMMQNVPERLYDSKAELAEMMVGKPEPEEESMGVSDMKETEGALRPTRTAGHDVMGKVQDLLARTAQEAEQAGDSETVAKLKSVLQMIGIG